MESATKSMKARFRVVGLLEQCQRSSPNTISWEMTLRQEGSEANLLDLKLNLAARPPFNPGDKVEIIINGR